MKVDISCAFLYEILHKITVFQRERNLPSLHANTPRGMKSIASIRSVGSGKHQILYPDRRKLSIPSSGKPVL